MKLVSIVLSISILLALGTKASAQKYSSEKSTVGFYSHATLEDIKANNTQSKAILDIANHSIAFTIPIRDFKFEKSLMQEHFNEKYMESDKFPRSTFQGKMTGFDINKKGLQQVSATGKITIHGITKDVEIPGTVEVINTSTIQLNSSFTIKLNDYQIKIPQLLWQKIAEQVEVKIDFTLIQK